MTPTMSNSFPITEEHGHAEEFVLVDGRRIGYWVYGAPLGKENSRYIVYFHGFLSSGMEAAVMETAARTHGFTVVGIDRPGYGASTPMDKPTVHDIAHATMEVVDHLEIQDMVVIGTSGALCCGVEGMPSCLGGVLWLLAVSQQGG